MTDIRRTLLWVVFTMSLVLLWDAWNRHTGQPTLFGTPGRSAPAAGAGPTGGEGGPTTPAAAGVPQPTLGPAAVGGVAAAVTPVPEIERASCRERVCMLV